MNANRHHSDTLAPSFLHGTIQTPLRLKEKLQFPPPQTFSVELHHAGRHARTSERRNVQLNCTMPVDKHVRLNAEMSSFPTLI
jgi:hypothetical protein